MAQIKNLDSLMHKLWKLERDALRQHTGNVIVGYQTSYAIYVHENLTAHHNVGQAKFLEQPARTTQNQLADLVKREMRNGVAGGRNITLKQALLKVGLRLQRESQKLVPVDTGMLKNSAFTDYE